MDSKVELYLDEDKFETVVMNLLSNAFKFTPEGGTITVATHQSATNFYLEVKDSGSGIAEQDLALIFDRFYQSPHIKNGEGMGVGLALSKELVTLHGGTIEARNEAGAVFTLMLQKGKAHLSPNQIIEADEHRPSISLSDKYVLRDDTVYPEKEALPTEQKAHILLVEDNADMASFIQDLLNEHYIISTAGDGQAGLDFLKTQKPDLIITDYLMPNMDGFEMAEAIKKDPELAYIPMIFLTARTREQDKINALNLGVDDYLYKPFNPEELGARINNLLQRKTQRQDFIVESDIDPKSIEWKEFASNLKSTLDAYIATHIKEEITGEQLADITNQSERSLYRKVKLNTGLSLMNYVKEYRLREARYYLENGDFNTVSEVAYAVGFNYLSHFSKSYLDRFGKNPSEYLD